MNKAQYLQALGEDYEAMVAAARQGLDPRVPGCPDWSVGGLMGHMVLVYANWNAHVRRWHDGEGLQKSDLDVYPGFAGWAETGFQRDGTPPALLEWLDENYRQMFAALAAADPAERIWTWFPPQQTAGFAQRRMALETAVHRWDAQSAHGAQQPIEPELACDGIDEVLDIHLPSNREEYAAPAGTGERYHFHRTDGEGEWLIVFNPDGVHVSRRHEKGDVAIRGTASDLLLWLWGRIPADRLEVIGDTGLLARWFELVPAD